MYDKIDIREYLGRRLRAEQVPQPRYAYRFLIPMSSMCFYFNFALAPGIVRVFQASALGLEVYTGHQHSPISVVLLLTSLWETF